jgi:hypothetical protein
MNSWNSEDWLLTFTRLDDPELIENLLKHLVEKLS